MNRSVCLLAVLIAVSSMFATTAPAQTDSTASEIAALRRELGALAARNQQQIDVLQQQVRELSGALAKSRRGRATAAAAPAGAHPAEPKPGAEAAANRRPDLEPGSALSSNDGGAGNAEPGPSPLCAAAEVYAGLQKELAEEIRDQPRPGAGANWPSKAGPMMPRSTASCPM